MKLLFLIFGLFAYVNCQFGNFNPFKPIANPVKLNPTVDGISKGVSGAVKGTVDTAKTAANAVLDAAWGEFKTLFNKSYSSITEELHRKEVFIENRAKILLFNENYGFGKSSFVQKINGFADILHHEFNELLNGFGKTKPTEKIVKPTSTPTTFIPSANVRFPKQVDWRETGAVTPVKNQQTCAACWAFASAGAIEGHYFRKTGKLNELSPQHLIDCTKEYGNSGCAGGLTNPAYEYVKEVGGINTLSNYPYEAKTSECRYKPEYNGGNDTGFVDIAEGDEAGLEAAVATQGPVSVAIDASRQSFQFYSEGIYYDAKCENNVEKLNHAVLVVGYGVEADGKEYWLVKNSYGPKWGIGGYIKMAKNQKNHCGIASYASYPLV